MDIDLSAYQGITSDSRAVKAGWVFAALSGAQYDGNDYVPQAIAQGATLIVSERPHNVSDHVKLLQVENARQSFAHMVADFYGGKSAQPSTIVAVTGTNGKSSVVSFVEQLWLALGHKAVSLGTINAKLTSLDPVSLHESLASLKADGVTHVALEASSHGLEQYRMDGAHISAAAFTNISRDHLDYHKTMEAYFDAKSMLFSRVVAEGGACVLNADVPEFAPLSQLSKGRVISYGQQGQDLQIHDMQPQASGTHLSLSIFGVSYQVDVPLVGGFQIHNLLCALGLVLAGEGEQAVEPLIAALSVITPVKGRMQSVHQAASDIGVYVDYAHTPDALETVLTAIKPHVSGRLWCVFGCGGDRDAGKRPLMGAVSANRSDITIITDDNPRNEKAVDIRNQILAPIREHMHNGTVFEIGDRAAAINFSIQNAQAGDCIVIAGKGHETGQILADKVIPFNDYDVAKAALDNRK